MEELIYDWDHINVILRKGKYTWNNMRLRLGHIAARLDRLLVHRDIVLDNQIITSHAISSSVLDHKTISLSIEKYLNVGPIPFNFNPL
jgi:hypothetical protein